jgi:hypothetical protein
MTPTKAMNSATTPTTTHRVLFLGIGYPGALDDGSTNEPDDHAYPVKLQGAHPRHGAAKQRSPSLCVRIADHSSADVDIKIDEARSVLDFIDNLASFGVRLSNNIDIATIDTDGRPLIFRVTIDIPAPGSPPSATKIDNLPEVTHQAVASTAKFTGCSPR